MAIILNNSLFLHFPKTGGKWVSKMLIDHVEGSKFVGDPIYDAHKSPEVFDKAPFIFTRYPSSWLHSLWHHRARKKANKFGSRFNWQNNHRLERECGSDNFDTFVSNVLSNTSCIYDYYSDFTYIYKDVKYLKYENLAENLCSFLNDFDEKFDKESILKSSKKYENTTKRGFFKSPNKFQFTVTQLDLLKENHSDFMSIASY